MGVPHFRLAEVQAQQGVPLEPATQYTVMDAAFRKPAAAVFGALERLAGAGGRLFLNDDTDARVIELERADKAKAEAAKKASEVESASKVRAGAAAAKGAKPDRKKVQTSAVIAHLDERTIALYYTGRRNAGENLAQVLSHRGGDATVPMQMCDGLSANHAKGYVTLLGNCLDHARRKYNDVEARFPEEVAFVLDTLGLIYKNDKAAKAAGLSPEERLAWHQELSAAPMQALETWARAGLAEKRIEPNSTLGGAVEYMLKRWLKLTAFLREAGMPLSSAEVERLIKRCIRHRKNSLHYMTSRGAELGDALMSIIQTCRYARESAHAYLTALARHSDFVCSEPDKWLPWNYRKTAAALGPHSGPEHSNCPGFLGTLAMRDASSRSRGVTRAWSNANRMRAVGGCRERYARQCMPIARRTGLWKGHVDTCLYGKRSWVVVTDSGRKTARSVAS